MKTSEQNNFFQPVISTFGLFTSTVATLLPIFSIDSASGLFINENFIKTVSIATFLIGFIIVWLIIEHQVAYIEIPIGEKKDRGNGWMEPWVTIRTVGFVWILITINVIVLITFLGLSNLENYYVSILQSFLYIIFFLILITCFAILFSSSKQKVSFENNKINFPSVIYDTLERYGHVSNTLEISSVSIANQEILISLGISGFHPLSKLLVIKTIQQPEKEFRCIVSGDGKELLFVEKIS